MFYMEEQKPRSPDTTRRPGEEGLRNYIVHRSVWDLYAIDYVSAEALTIVYLESRVAYRFKDAYDQIVSRKFLARVEVADNLYAINAQQAAQSVVAQANQQRIYAVNCAGPG